MSTNTTQRTQQQLLALALLISEQAHHGQVVMFGARRDENYYTAHVIPVVNRVRTFDSEDYSALTVAALHDVVEDTELTFADLREAGFDAVVLDALRLLTRNDKSVIYRVMIERLAHATGEAGRVARAVKRADLWDHLRDMDAAHSLRTRYNNALAALNFHGVTS